ncbi:MAG: ATP-binding protein [Candidatus Gastranaerophilales bacterium]|nr:ATP-binding protein [Candidatus Gastranaerophilales bacterium]
MAKIIKKQRSGGISSQNKLMLLGLVTSSVLIILVAAFVIHTTQKKIFDSYYKLGLMMTKTLAVQAIDEQTAQGAQYELIKANAETLTQNHADIGSVTFKDQSGKTIFASQKEGNIKESNLCFSSPVVIEKTDGTKQTIGSIELGLNGQTLQTVKTTTKSSMIIIFIVAWGISVFAVMVNTMLLTRQIGLLVDGVSRISSGDFGYTVNTKDLWGDIKHLFDSFNDMSSRLRLYDEKNIDKLTYERNKLEAVLMSIVNGVVVCDKFDKVILFNNSALKILGLDAKTIMDAKIQDYYDSDGELCFKDKIEQFKNTPLEDMEADGPEFQVKIDHKVYKTVISPMFNLNQEYMGYIIVLHDMTKEAEIDQMKNNFISNVSHELRTPVTVLRSYIDTLYNYGADFNLETQKEFIGILNQEITRLNVMVNDILDFSRLESPNVKLEKGFANIAPIIELVVSSVDIIAKEKDLTFSVIIEPNLPKVYMNSESIERAIKNLLSNAIKYSHKGGRVKVRAEVDKTGKNIEVAVEDNGIGINQEHLPKIFDRFYRVENATHTIKGTGIGLHLVKIAIEKHHNGEVFVASKEHEGSTFGFRLPISKDTPKDVTEPQNKQPQEIVACAKQSPDDGWEITLEKK